MDDLTKRVMDENTKLRSAVKALLNVVEADLQVNPNPHPYRVAAVQHGHEALAEGPSAPKDIASRTKP